MRWRWDQGRLDYFQFDNIVRMARVLSGLDGLRLDTSSDLLRMPLERATGLPFSPAHYKVWRNYARVFACAMLATKVDGKLLVTDLCRQLAKDPPSLTSDQYLNFVFTHFAYPYPAFDGYDPNTAVSYPFLAIAKYVFTRPFGGVTLQDVFSHVVGNRCSGLEDLTHYTALRPTRRKPLGDEERQVREMLAFMGQSSFLKWFDRKLFPDSHDVSDVFRALRPDVRVRRSDAAVAEFLQMTSTGTETSRKRLEVRLADRALQPMSFFEGQRQFGVHGKLERSPLVRRYYFGSRPELICDACRLDVKKRYPWTDNILELHHVLPLAATIDVNGTTTLLEDLVPLCPSCHKSIHVYYRKKLEEWGVEDFGSKKMAKDVYRLAKSEIVCS